MELDVVLLPGGEYEQCRELGEIFCKELGRISVKE